jgi:hypothetical protein
MSRTQSQVPDAALEKICGRAALLAGDVEGYAGAGFCLELEGRVTDDLGKEQ